MRADELDNEHVERPGRIAGRVGTEAVEQALAQVDRRDADPDAVDISLYVKGRMIATTTDSATVHKIMALLTGLGG